MLYQHQERIYNRGGLNLTVKIEEMTLFFVAMQLYERWIYHRRRFLVAVVNKYYGDWIKPHIVLPSVFVFPLFWVYRKLSSLTIGPMAQWLKPIQQTEVEVRVPGRSDFLVAKNIFN